jgi:hypothetical protein
MAENSQPVLTKILENLDTLVEILVNADLNDTVKQAAVKWYKDMLAEHYTSLNIPTFIQDNIQYNFQNDSISPILQEALAAGDVLAVLNEDEEPLRTDNSTTPQPNQRLRGHLYSEQCAGRHTCIRLVGDKNGDVYNLGLWYNANTQRIVKEPQWQQITKGDVPEPFMVKEYHYDPIENITSISFKVGFSNNDTSKLNTRYNALQLHFYADENVAFDHGTSTTPFRIAKTWKPQERIHKSRNTSTERTHSVIDQIVFDYEHFVPGGSQWSLVDWKIINQTSTHRGGEGMVSEELIKKLNEDMRVIIGNEEAIASCPVFGINDTITCKYENQTGLAVCARSWISTDDGPVFLHEKMCIDFEGETISFKLRDLSKAKSKARLWSSIEVTDNDRLYMFKRSQDMFIQT